MQQITKPISPYLQKLLLSTEHDSTEVCMEKIEKFAHDCFLTMSLRDYFIRDENGNDIEFRPTEHEILFSDFMRSGISYSQIDVPFSAWEDVAKQIIEVAKIVIMNPDLKDFKSLPEYVELKKYIKIADVRIRNETGYYKRFLWGYFGIEED